MNAIPHIIVQLVHIEGPLKGEIQELSAPEIVIGRHPDCQVRFPKDVVILSRRHARILREGNRFKLVDQSTNGTYVNGRKVPEAYLKDGDVITFAEGGPKISFLTQVTDPPVPQPAAPQPAQAAPVQNEYSAAPPSPAPVPPNTASPASPSPEIQAVHPQPTPPPPAAQPAVENVKVPFAIQYGAALKSFQVLPITLGRGAGCDFIIDHPAILDRQAQIFFAQDRYWIKDLTGGNAIQINGLPIADQASLEPDMRIALSPQGPRFRFLGGGRLAEAEDPVPEPQAPPPPEEPPAVRPTPKPDTMGEKAGALFKKLFS